MSESVEVKPSCRRKRCELHENRDHLVKDETAHRSEI